MAASELFDIGDEIQLVDQAPDRLGIEPQEAFHLCQTCGMVAAIVPAFEVEKTEQGCRISCYGKICVHEVEIRAEARQMGDGSLIWLSSQVIEDKAPQSCEPFFAGYAHLPESWLGVVRHIYKAERSILWMADFAERLKAEWQKFLDVRKERLGF